MARDRLVDILPGGLGEYAFDINHSDEDQAGQTVNIETTAPVAGMGHVYQVSDVSPLVFHWKGTILRRSQLQALWQFFLASNGYSIGPKRTIHLIDFTDARFEVLFAAFNPTKQRVVNNPRGTSPEERLYKWSYDATFNVIRAISGYP